MAKAKKTKSPRGPSLTKSCERAVEKFSRTNELIRAGRFVAAAQELKIATTAQKSCVAAMSRTRARQHKTLHSR